MTPVLPFWFKQRQGKAEPAGDNVLRLTGPNLAEAWIAIRQSDNGLWAAAVKQSADGADLDATEPRYEKATDAWEAAFELYRRAIVV